jgi:hypothetical protein
METNEFSGGFFTMGFHLVDCRARRAFPAPFYKIVNCGLISLRHRFNGAIASVPDPSLQSQAKCGLPGGGSIKNPLNVSGNF